MILELIQKNDFKAAYELLKSKENIANYANEYNNKRDIRETQVGKREDKSSKEKVIPVNKIPIPFQRKIVRSAATFLFGSAVKLIQLNKGDESESKLNDAFKALTTLWDDLRLDSLLLKFAKAVKSETEAAIVFFPVKKEEKKGIISRIARLLKLKGEINIKARLLDHKSGKLLPVFDEYGDMEAFGWEFLKKVEGKDVKHLYLFTAEKTYFMTESGDGWENVEGFPQANLFQKIPVVYLSQDMPEWFDVLEIIDRFEMSYSKFCDTNDYFADPKYKAKGKINQSLHDTKVVELEIVETSDGKIIYGDLEIISWEHAPESVKLELETGKGLIYGLTDTPDLSFDNVKGLGNISGVALKLLFFASILKAKEDEGDYKVTISRIINVMKAGISNILSTNLSNSLEELQVDIEFTSVLPENIKEMIEVLTEATGGAAVMSQKTAVAHNPLVEDNEQEMVNINEESVVNMGESTEA